VALGYLVRFSLKGTRPASFWRPNADELSHLQIGIDQATCPEIARQIG
jgi:hypothetical protein